VRTVDLRPLIISDEIVEEYGQNMVSRPGLTLKRNCASTKPALVFYIQVDTLHVKVKPSFLVLSSQNTDVLDEFRTYYRLEKIDILLRS
jgi:hypothetical protein